MSNVNLVVSFGGFMVDNAYSTVISTPESPTNNYNQVINSWLAGKTVTLGLYQNAPVAVQTTITTPYDWKLGSVSRIYDGRVYISCYPKHTGSMYTSIIKIAVYAQTIELMSPTETSYTTDDTQLYFYAPAIYAGDVTSIPFETPVTDAAFDWARRFNQFINYMKNLYQHFTFIGAALEQTVTNTQYTTTVADPSMLIGQNIGYTGQGWSPVPDLASHITSRYLFAYIDPTVFSSDITAFPRRYIFKTAGSSNNRLYPMLDSSTEQYVYETHSILIDATENDARMNIMSLEYTLFSSTGTMTVKFKDYEDYYIFLNTIYFNSIAQIQHITPVGSVTITIFIEDVPIVDMGGNENIMVNISFKIVTRSDRDIRRPYSPKDIQVSGYPNNVTYFALPSAIGLNRFGLSFTNSAIGSLDPSAASKTNRHTIFKELSTYGNMVTSPGYNIAANGALTPLYGMSSTHDTSMVGINMFEPGSIYTGTRLVSSEARALVQKWISSVNTVFPDISLTSNDLLSSVAISRTISAEYTWYNSSSGPFTTIRNAALSYTGSLSEARPIIWWPTEE